jgi:hypothetical protein
MKQFSFACFRCSKVTYWLILSAALYRPPSGRRSIKGFCKAKKEAKGNEKQMF